MSTRNIKNQKRLTWKRSLDGYEDVGLCEGVTVGEAICKLADLEEQGAVQRESGENCSDERRDRKLAVVIRMLEKEYDRAKRLDFVRKPLAYALYHVWKKVDERG